MKCNCDPHIEYCDICLAERREREAKEPINILKTRIAELEAKHPEWMKRIQRERQEERERIIQVLLRTNPMEVEDRSSSVNPFTGSIIQFSEGGLRRVLDLEYP